MSREIKICSKCFEEKPIRELSLRNIKRNIHHNICKECMREYSREHYITNKTIIWQKRKEFEERNPNNATTSKRKYRINNKEKCLLATRKWAQKYPEKQLKAQYSWRENNREKYLAQVSRSNKKTLSTLKGRLNLNLGNQIRRYIKTGKKGKSWKQILKYTLKELMCHLESKFKEGMAWGNYGKWEIDHIKPVSSFNFKDYNNLSFHQCWSLNNLQPLWKSENRKKSNKILCKEMI